MATLRISNCLQKVLSSGLKIPIRLSSTKFPNVINRLPYWLKTFPDGRIRSFEEIPGPQLTMDERGIYRSAIEEYSSDEIHKAHASWLEEYGYVVREYFSEDRWAIHLYHPQDMKMVYESDCPTPARDSLSALAKYRHGKPHLYNCAGLGASNGAEWMHLRKYVQNGLTGSNYTSHTATFREVVDDLLSKIKLRLDENKEIDITPWLFRWALESIGVLTLNTRLGALSEGNEEADAVVEAAKVTHEMIYRTSNNVGDQEDNYKKLAEAQDYFSSVVLKYMDEVPIGASYTSLVNKLKSEGCDWKDINTLILDIFQGGIHNLSFTLVYALLNIAEHKRVQDTARELLANDPLKGYRYLESILNESLRLNPPIIGNGRISQRDLVLGGYHVPAGTQIILQHAVASRQEENFKDALKFMPERNIYGMFDYSYWAVPPTFAIKYATFIFGHGPRICIGKTFADLQMPLVLKEVMQNFDVSYHHHKIDTINRLHNEPVGPVKLRFESRSL